MTPPEVISPKSLPHALLDAGALTDRANEVGGPEFALVASKFVGILDKAGKTNKEIATSDRLSNEGKQEELRDEGGRVLGELISASSTAIRDLTGRLVRARSAAGGTRRFAIGDLAKGKTKLGLASDGDFVERPALPPAASLEGGLLLNQIQVAQQELLALRSEPKRLNAAVVGAFENGDLVTVVALDQLPGTLTDEIARKAVLQLDALRGRLHERLRPAEFAEVQTLEDLLTPHLSNLWTARRTVEKLYGGAGPLDGDALQRFARIAEPAERALRIGGDTVRPQ